MPKQDSVAKLAKTNFEAALKHTSKIEDPGKRIQALGWVARFAPASRVEPTVQSALKLAHAPTDDAYAQFLALAWPLRALHETKNAQAIPSALEETLRLAQDVEPTSSRAEAIGLLIHALLPAGIDVASPAIDALLKLCSGDDHWRIVRAFSDVAVLVNGYDKARANKIARAMPAGNKRDATLEKLAAGETSKVRKFFW